MKSFHTAAYVFRADIQCCDCISNWAVNELFEESYTADDIEIVVRDKGPAYDVGFLAYRSSALLDELGTIKQINVEDEYSYDSDDFPKIIFADQLEETEYCGSCGKVIR